MNLLHDKCRFLDLLLYLERTDGLFERRGGLMVSLLDYGSSASRSNSGQGHHIFYDNCTEILEYLRWL